MSYIVNGNGYRPSGRGRTVFTCISGNFADRHKGANVHHIDRIEVSRKEGFVCSD